MEKEIRALVERIEEMSVLQKISALNKVKAELHKISPFKNEPIDCVLWIPCADVSPNQYNPNSVAPPEMRLLKHSIDYDGYTQPIVTWKKGATYKIVDGEHRVRVGTEIKRIKTRILSHLPVTVVRKNRGREADRMAATIRHNRARGTHAVTSMTDIVAAMLENGLSDGDVATELGMDTDEFLRFKQNTGMPELFKDHEYSKSWEVK